MTTNLFEADWLEFFGGPKTKQKEQNRQNRQKVFDILSEVYHEGNQDISKEDIQNTQARIKTWRQTLN